MRFGPYLSERAWGTVREDYSPDGEAWTFFPHDHARSRAYRWSEDGLGAICDDQQLLCLAFAFWNGRDPILKERIFGLTGDEANHGEDAKEYWWYLDSTPSHSWMRWRYAYPQAAFPYEDLIEVNGRRGHGPSPSTSCSTPACSPTAGGTSRPSTPRPTPATSASTSRSVTPGPEQATLHLLPTLWFRNTWSWDEGATKPSITSVDGGALRAEHEQLGTVVLAGDGSPQPLFCDNETNTRRLWSADGPAVSQGWDQRPSASTGAPTVNPEPDGDEGRAALPADGGGRRDRRDHVAARPRAPVTSGQSTRPRAAARVRSEADAFYGSIAPAATDDERHVMRQAFAGMLWCKQFYHYDVQRWLDGDPTQIPATAEPAAWSQQQLGARRQPRRHLDARQVGVPVVRGLGPRVSLVTLSHVDPEFAKEQLRLITREWYMNPNGQLPAYEWDFGDVNPPVHAFAALQVFINDGATDHTWLERIFHKMLLGFTWWANVKDPGRRPPVRRRLPRDGQRRPVRSLGAAAPGAGARAGRRHRLDGALLPEHARDLARTGRARQRLRGRRDQVLRALRDDRRGDQRTGSVGRVRRLLLRPGPPGLRRHRLSGPGPVDDRAAAVVRGRQRAPGAAPGARGVRHRGRDDSSSCTRSMRRRFSPRPGTRRW